MCPSGTYVRCRHQQPRALERNQRTGLAPSSRSKRPAVLSPTATDCYTHAVADTQNGSGSRAAALSERVKNGSAVLAAVAGSVTALWGVYDKVRTEARKDTAASYNTLAPELNRVSEALKQVQDANQQLREELERRVAADAAGRAAGPARPASRPAGRPKPPVSEPTAAAPAAPPSAPSTTAEAPPPAGGDPGNPFRRIANTVRDARAAVESVRRVPDSFDKVRTP